LRDLDRQRGRPLEAGRERAQLRNEQGFVLFIQSMGERRDTLVREEDGEQH